jgi:peptide-methionine (S)-S-oxide reductase
MANLFRKLFLSLVLLGVQVRADDAILAGGCFWCVEADLEKIKGVIEVTSGYSGGQVTNPSYDQVSAGHTGHFEVVKVTYDAQVLSYESLLEKFWTLIDPLDSKGQFCDQGAQYRSAIFYGSEREQQIAESSKKRVEAALGPIATLVLPAKEFFPAEDYHQNYYKTHSWRYKYYRYRCGRDARLEEVRKLLAQ